LGYELISEFTWVNYSEDDMCGSVFGDLVKWGWFLVHSTKILNGTIVNVSIKVGKVEVKVREQL
jgi:hypothetical protein